MVVLYIVFGLLYLLIPLSYLATAIVSLTKRKHGEVASSALPSVTVLVPTFNDGDSVRRIINSLEVTDYPENKLEIVFIDDSNDSTSEIIDEFASRRSNVRVLRREKRLGKPSALNDGLAASSGEVVVVYDADSAPHPSAIRKLVATLSGEVVAAQGSYEVDVRNTLNKIVDLEYTLWQGSQLVAVPVIVGYNYAVKRSYLEEIGGWDEEALAEDHILWYKIYSDGKKIRYVEDAGVRVLEPLTFREFEKQRARWSKGSIQATEKVIKTKGRMIPKPYLPNFLAYTSRYSAPSQTAVSLVALTLTLVAYFAFPQIQLLLYPFILIFLSAIVIACVASLLFCLRMGKVSRWLYFLPLSFLVLYQNILFSLVIKKDVSWEKVEK
ncbi:MAG: glycosyltransferase family 2 protein [Candidatus Freyarchaeota archaeon]|nr:glycosyltransferase family 2 protein [Candidatus Jordarchaeia archaeon]